MEHPCASCHESACEPVQTTRRTFLLAGLALPVFFAIGAAAGSERRYPIPPDDSVTIDRAAQTIIVRARSHLYAFALSCPHQNNALRWLQKDGRFQCPKHESKYQPDGTFTSGRATRNMDRFAVRQDDAELVVDLTRWFQSDKDPAGWAAAQVVL
jgi:nitrite reductase/ring-hydroxylating ferredoxin subunit